MVLLMKSWTTIVISALFCSLLLPTYAGAQQPERLRYYTRLTQAFIDSWYTPCLGEKKMAGTNIPYGGIMVIRAVKCSGISWISKKKPVRIMTLSGH
ncbi:hypothetical protein OS42_09120 [Dickeya oryzae]